jgi:hypothetical protein
MMVGGGAVVVVPPPAPRPPGVEGIVGVGEGVVGFAETAGAGAAGSGVEGALCPHSNPAAAKAAAPKHEPRDNLRMGAS